MKSPEELGVGCSTLLLDVKLSKNIKVFRISCSVLYSKREECFDSCIRH